MIKFLLKEVHANSSGNGTKGYSKQGKDNGRPSALNAAKAAKAAKTAKTTSAVGSKRKHLTNVSLSNKGKKGKRPSSIMPM